MSDLSTFYKNPLEKLALIMLFEIEFSETFPRFMSVEYLLVLVTYIYTQEALTFAINRPFRIFASHFIHSKMANDSIELICQGISSLPNQQFHIHSVNS